MLGFAEMGTMRLGSLLDQPRMVRMQSVTAALEPVTAQLRRGEGLGTASTCVE